MQWLMLRGLAREKRHYGAFPALFADQLHERTVTLDLPGFGTEHTRDSPTSIAAITDDVRARFRAAEPSSEPGAWSIFAISLGGMVALDWLARYPDDFERVVVANTSAADLSPPWERFSTSMMRRLPSLLLSAAPADRERTILDITSNAPHVDKGRLAAEWAGFYAERPPHRLNVARQLYAATTSRLPALSSSQVAKTLVLTSRADRLVSYRCSEKIAHKLGAKIHVHDDAGHDLSLDAPDWICERIAASC